METTIVYSSYNGKENGNNYSILGLYKDDGEETRNDYGMIGYIFG